MGRRGQVSAGLLMFRRRHARLEFLIAHPGGPLFRNRQEGAWTLPKGRIEPGEDPLTAAKREFSEETGFSSDAPQYFDLGTVRLKSGKTVYGFAFEGDCDPRRLRSMRFEMEWPRRSGNTRTFPEVDQLRFVPAQEAERLLHPAQARFVARLVEHLSAEGAEGKPEAQAQPVRPAEDAEVKRGRRRRRGRRGRRGRGGTSRAGSGASRPAGSSRPPRAEAPPAGEALASNPS